MLDEVSEEVVIRRIQESSHRGSVFLLAPNYEERSLGSANLLARIADAVNPNLLSALVVKFESGLTPVLLDAVKDSNSARALSTLRDHGVARVVPHPVRWPLSQQSIAPLLSHLLDLCRGTADCVDLYVDISAIPRSLLLGVMDDLFARWSTAGVATGRHSSVASISIVYTPALRYPRHYSDDLLGAIQGKYSSRRLEDFVSHPSDTVDLVLSLAGTGHDAAQVLGAIPSFGAAAVNIRPLMYMSVDNTAESFAKYALNAWSLRELRRLALSPRYAFGVAHLSRLLKDDAAGTAVRHAVAKNDSAHYLLAGFGPKPLGFACYLAKRVYDRELMRRQGWVSSDVLLTRGAQYSTLYSIGAGITRVWEIDIDAILGSGSTGGGEADVRLGG